MQRPCRLARFAFLQRRERAAFANASIRDVEKDRAVEGEDHRSRLEIRATATRRLPNRSHTGSLFPL
jgi:hypothetical protein